MEEQIREFIRKKILFEARPVGARDSLFASGVIDSIGHLRLVAFLEKEFGVAFSLSDLTVENFDTVERIATLVRAKRSGRS